MRKVVVILVDWNGEEVTRECLTSLQQVILPASVQLSVVLVDNGSIKPLPQSIQTDFPFVSLLRSDTNLGFTGGNNWGIDIALEQDPTYILFLNNDTVVSTDFLTPLLNHLESNSETAAVQPKICFYPDKSRIWNAGNKFYSWITQTGIRGYGELDKGNDSYIREQPWLTGCALLARASIFKGQKGLRFKERFFALYEDVDLSFTMRRMGWKLFYISSSIIYHRAGFSSRAKVKTKEGYTHPYMIFLNSRNRIWLARLYTPLYYWPTTFLFLLGYFTLLLPYFLLRGRFTKAFFVIKAIKEGILTRPV